MFHDIKDADQGKDVFTRAMAKQIIEFAIALPKNIKYIAVNCFQEISRSAVVIKFLSKYIFRECYSQKFDEEYDNRIVYDMLEEIWMEEHGKLKE